MHPSLPWLITWAAIALGSLLFLVAVLRRRRAALSPPGLPDEWPLAARPVFSADERSVYRQLREALPAHAVLCKLPLLRFCHPNDPASLRYWYELLGSLNVSFAICTGSGRVLAAIDIESGGRLSRRGQRIKESVLGACEVRYLRCKAHALPTIPELQLMVADSVHAEPAAAAPVWASYRPAGTPESSGFIDSFLLGWRRSTPAARGGAGR